MLLCFTRLAPMLASALFVTSYDKFVAWCPVDIPRSTSSAEKRPFVSLESIESLLSLFLSTGRLRIGDPGTEALA